MTQKKHHQKALLILLLFLPISAVRPAVNVTPNTDSSGKPTIAIENDFLRLTLAPHRGGRCSSLLLKATGEDFADAHGAMIERLWQQPPPGEFEEAPYECELIQNEQAAGVRLTVRAKSSEFRGLQIEKTITLPKDACRVNLDYRITNLGDKSLEFGFWAFNYLGPPKVTSYVCPTTEGIESFRNLPSEKWVWNPARGWTGMVGDTSGLVCVTDFSQLQCLYWCPTGAPRATVEWRYEEQILKPKEVYATSVTYLPFHGLSSLSGAGKNLVGDFAVGTAALARGDKSNVTLRLSSSDNGDVDVKITAQRLPGGSMATVTTQSTKLGAGKVTEIVAPYLFSEGGTYGLHGTASRQGTLLAEFFKQVVVGEPTGILSIPALGKAQRVFDEPPISRHLTKANRPLLPLMETSHFNWAVPLAGGPIRTLFLMPFNTPRDAVELAQRISMDYTILPFGLDEKGELASFITDDLNHELQRGYQLIIAAGFPFRKLIAASRQQFVATIQKGTGLLCVQCDPPSELVNQWSLSEIDVPQLLFPKGEPPRSEHCVLAGRVARIGYGSGVRVPALLPDFSPYEHRYSYWEYYFAALAKEALWASGRDHGLIQIASISPSALYGKHGRVLNGVKRADVITFTSGKPRVTLTLEGTAGTRGEVTAMFRDTDSRLLSSQSKPFTFIQPLEKVSFEVPTNTSAGCHALDFVVKREDGSVCDWTASFVEVLADVELLTVKIDREWYAVNETILATASLRNRNTVVAAVNVKAELFDVHNRLVAADAQRITLLRATSPTVTFRLRTPKPLTTLHTLKVTVTDAGGLIASRDYPLYIPVPAQERWDDVVFFTWSAEPAFYLRRPYHQLLQRLGFNAIIGTEREEDLRTYLEDDLNFTQYGGGGDSARYLDKGPVREPCFSNPQVGLKIAEGYATFAKASRKFGPIAHAITDESSLSVRGYGGEVCFCEFCRARFQQWLKERYKTLTALNDEWSTDFKDWTEIRTVKESEAKQLKNPARWVDFHTFMEDYWLDFITQARSGVERSNPGVPFGLPNSFGLYPWTGDNYYKYSKVITHSQEYPYETFGRYSNENHFDILRSFTDAGVAGRKIPMPGWIGYNNEEESYRLQPWWLAFHGGCGASYFMAGTTDLRGGYYTHVHPLLSPSLKGQWMEANTRDLREGVGKLLIHAQRTQTQVAVFYPQESLYVASLEGTLAEYHSSRNLLTALLADASLQYNFVAPEQIAQGELAKYRAVVLPHVSAISEETLQVLHQFVERGGLVLADARCGLTDQHGKPRESWRFWEQLFGIRSGQRLFTKGQFSVTLKGGWSEAGAKPRMLEGKESISLAGGKVIGEFGDRSPAVVVNAIGAGWCVYIAGVTPFSDEWKQTLLRAFELGKVTPPVKITNEGKTVTGYETTLFQLGTLRYLGVLRDYRISMGEETVELKLPLKSHLYDVRQKKYLGFTDHTRLTLPPGAAAFFALSPYRVKSVSVTAVLKATRGQRGVVNVRVHPEAGVTSDHILHMEVFSPNGQKANWYSKNIFAVSGRCEFAIPFALNDTIGKWRVVAKDVMSNKAVEEGAIWLQ